MVPTTERASELVDLANEASKACERLLGQTPLSVERPGGPTRRSIRVELKDRHVIATHRRHAERAQLEARVLQALKTQGAPVPQVLAFDGEWLIQEYLGQHRLSQKLAVANETESEALLENALTGLASAQQAGNASQLNKRTITIGHREEWLLRLATIPEHISDQIKFRPPALQTDKLVAQLYPKQPAFIKWDARPANAIVRSDASVAWFDWEHCGCRNPIDDMVWLLCDEYNPDWPDVEARLIKKLLPLFVNGSSQDENNNYLMTHGALHSCVRLSLILTEKAGGPWWNVQQCIDQDKVGVTRDLSIQLCRRAVSIR